MFIGIGLASCRCAGRYGPNIDEREITSYESYPATTRIDSNSRDDPTYLVESIVNKL